MENYAALKLVRRQIFVAVVLLAGCSGESQRAPQAMEVFEDTLASIEQTLAGEASLIEGARGEVFFADDRLVYRYNPETSFTIALHDQGQNDEVRLSDEQIKEQLLPLVDFRPLDPREWYVDGLSADKSAIIWRRDRLRVAVPVDGGPGTRLAQTTCGPPRLISDQFPTTFGPLYERKAPMTCRFLTQQGGNLFVRTGYEDELRALTTSGTDQWLWGGSDESAPELNAYWSPDEAWVAAVRLDERSVPREPVMRYLETPPRVDMITYPRSGEPLQKFSIHAIATDRSERVDFVLPDTTDHYANIIGWNADGSGFFVQVVDRDHSSIEILRADLADRAIERILSLESASYIDTLYTVGPPVAYPFPSREGAFASGLLFFSEETGSRELYALSADGSSRRRLTEGFGVVHEVVAIREDVVYVMAAADFDRPYDHHLIKIPLDGSEPVRLTPEQGHHRVRSSQDGTSFVAVRSTIENAPVVEWRDQDGDLISVVDRADPTRLLDAGYSGAEEIWTTSATGERQRGVLFRPFDFDPSVSYPVVEVIYGGMQLVHTPRDFYGFGRLAGGYNADPAKILLRQGFAVFYLDSPGTPERGRAFQDVTYATWPQGVMRDHADWLREVAEDRPWLDLDRVGIYGNSWGGYLATRALIDEPSLYKAAVAMAAPQDFVDHPMYIEPFMGRPADNPDGYEVGSNLRYAEQIDGDLLVISYPLDVNAGFSPSMKLIRTMMDNGRDVEFFMVPETNHRITCCREDDAHYVYAKITRFLREELASLE